MSSPVPSTLQQALSEKKTTASKTPKKQTINNKPEASQKSSSSKVQPAKSQSNTKPDKKASMDKTKSSTASANQEAKNQSNTKPDHKPSTDKTKSSSASANQEAAADQSAVSPSVSIKGKKEKNTSRPTSPTMPKTSSTEAGTTSPTKGGSDSPTAAISAPAPPAKGNAANSAVVDAEADKRLEQHIIDTEIQRRQLEDAVSIQSFYTAARTYWDKIEPTIDGMLGGFADINPIDIHSSRAYLESMFRLHPTPRRHYALDCGAGIGRVTKSLLLPLYDQVDAVEQCEKFADQMPSYVRSPKLTNVFNCGLQRFVPDAGRYDLIWAQWVLGHLTDADLVAFFQRCAKGLTHGGILVLKENVTSSGATEIDETDSSLTRPLGDLRRLLTESGWRILRCTMQQNLPAGMYPVYMITARPMPQRFR